MTARKDGLSRTPSVLCGERMERQEAVLFVGVRMVGSCFISIPASASITEQKMAADPFKRRGLPRLVRAVRSALLASACENALQVDEARRMRRGIEIALFGRRLRRSSSGLRAASRSL